MPLYEYICDETGEVVEELRPMAEADEPLPDPENKGRVFRRKHSTFQAQGGSPRVATGGGGGGGCACGHPHGCGG
jgi:putative FmdB family regulatory protein